MSDVEKTQGACVFCGKRMTRGGMSRHLRTCAARRAAIQAADAGPGKKVRLLHLVAQDAWDGIFWLHLEMRGDEEVGELDWYLRRIWLECCDHLSAFEIGRMGGRIEMDEPAARVFTPDREVIHAYDFGTTTNTRIHLVSERVGRPLTGNSIHLMARNEDPVVPCAECGAAASSLCLECLYEGENAVLCNAHAAVHPHDEYGEPMPLFNSPRSGVCGYDGPAQPPY